MRYVLKNKNGKYAGLNKQRAWCAVDSFDAAKELTLKKANNVKMNCLESPESWELVGVEYNLETLGKDGKMSANVEQYVDQLEGLAKNLRKMVEILTAEMSNADQKVQGVTHYIEFNQFGAADGYKAYKLMHDCLKERRQIKDDMFIVHAMYEGRIQDISQGVLQRAILGMEKRKYKPRQIPELFTKIIK